jgi:hypothetical protein
LQGESTSNPSRRERARREGRRVKKRANEARRSADVPRQKKKPPFDAEETAERRLHTDAERRRSRRVEKKGQTNPSASDSRVDVPACSKLARSGCGLFRLDLDDELRQARLLARRVVLVPQSTSSGAIKRATDLGELRFSGGNVARFKRLNESFDTVASNRTRRSVAEASNFVLSQSFFSAKCVWHLDIALSGVLKNLLKTNRALARGRMMGEIDRRVR